MAYTSPAATARPRFWIEFGLFSDGQETTAARDMARRQGLDEFALFPQLPTELRLKVWELLLAPRVIQAACLEAATADTQRDMLLPQRGGGQGTMGSGGGRLRRRANRSCVPVPVLLHINREARELGLKHYELAFSWKVPHVLAQMDIVSTSPPGSGPSSPSSSFHDLEDDIVDDISTTMTTTSSQNQRPPSPSTQLVQKRQQQRCRKQKQGNQYHSSSRRAASPPAPPTWSEPRVYFNFAHDSIYLKGELEAYDPYGFNAPMTYFLKMADARRTRRVAVSFGALGYGAGGPQQIFGALFHVADRFAAAQDGQVLVCVKDEDEITHAELGGMGGLVVREDQTERSMAVARNCVDGAADGEREDGGEIRGINGEGSNGSNDSSEKTRRSKWTRNAQDDNVMQKIWHDWYRGSIVTSSLAKMKFVLVREEELDEHAWDTD